LTWVEEGQEAKSEEEISDDKMRKFDLLLVTVPGAVAFAIATLLIIVAEFVPQPSRAIIDEVLIKSAGYSSLGGWVR
jgi:hypothetical protein